LAKITRHTKIKKFPNNYQIYRKPVKHMAILKQSKNNPYTGVKKSWTTSLAQG